MGYTIEPTKVRGDLFTDTGKWKYTVVLDYGFPEFDWEHWDLWTMAEKAFANGTGVTMTKIPAGWTLVVLEPYSKFEHPISIKGE